MASASTSTSSASATLTKAALLAGLTRVAGAVAAKTTLPVLSNVLIKPGEGGVLRIVGTDLDVTVDTVVDAALAGSLDGVTLPAKKLTEFVKECGSAPIALMVKNNASASVKSGAARMTLSGISADEFPDVAERAAKAVTLFSVPAGTLAALAKPVAPSASTEESRPILNGVLLEVGAVTGEGDAATRTVRMVATNGHRLALTDTAFTGEAAGAASPAAQEIILTPKVLALIGSVFAPNESVAVAVAPEQNQIVVRGAATTVIGRTIEGPFPPYRQVIPTEHKLVVEVDRTALMQTLRRVSVMASDQTHRIALRVTGAGAEANVSVTATTPDAGEAEDSVGVQIVTGTLADATTGFRIGFNASYLLDLLKPLPTDSVRLSFTEPERAAVIEPVYGDEKPSVTSAALLMPLRILD